MLFKKYLPLILTSFIFSCLGNEPTTTTDSTDENQIENNTETLTSPFQTFVNYFDGLEATFENLDSVFAKYDALNAEFSQEEHDSSLFLVKEFMYKFEIPEEEYNDYSDKSYDKMMKKYEKAGFEIWGEEGYYYSIPDNAFLQKKFKKTISPELDDYLDVLKKVDFQITADAGLIIPYEDLADHVLICEDYLVENQDSKYFNDVMVLYHDRLNFLMWGLDNTPTINNWNEDGITTLEPEVEKAYNNVIADKKHKTGLIIKDHLDYLISVNYSYDDFEWISEKEIKLYLGL